MGGGGNSAGANSWPSYMMETHFHWLDHLHADAVKYSVTALMSQAQDNSPYKEFSAFNPVELFGTLKAPVFTALETFRNLNIGQIFAQTQAELNGDVLLKAVKSQADLLEDELEQRLLPEFKAGMRNINAVQSSAFVVGEGLLRTAVVKSLSRFSSEIQMKLLDVTWQLTQLKVNFQKDVIIQTVETSRIFLAAQMDAVKFNSETAAKDRLWNLRTYEYGSQVMAGISGGVSNGGPQESSSVSNALGGAMSGAAIGAQVGSQSGNAGWGAAIGAVAGGIAGAFK